MHMYEPLTGLYHSSKLLLLDFATIPDDTPASENIRDFFESCELQGINPRLPENRQKFNNQMLSSTGNRYLVSRYGEDRKAMLTGSHIAKEGRTIHMGLDIFCHDLEIVYAPCDGTIVRTGREPENHSYGNYVILQPNDLPNVYFFLGHLSTQLPKTGAVHIAQPIARLGDYTANENGGWSRHLHLQVIRTLPKPQKTPDGYASRSNFSQATQEWPNPLRYFPEWNIVS